jgi:hypothetical protein
VQREDFKDIKQKLVKGEYNPKYFYRNRNSKDVRGSEARRKK